MHHCFSLVINSLIRSLSQSLAKSQQLPTVSSASASTMASAGEPTAATKKVVLLLVPRVNATFHALLHERFHILDFFASSEPLPAFLAAAAAAAPDPPRAAVVVGAGLIPVDAAFLDAVPSLRCVVSLAAGVDFIDLAECARRGVAVANSGAVFSADVADHAVGLLIDVLRRVSAGDRLLRRCLSPPAPALGSKIGGRRVGIVGLGNIGSRIATRLQALGCTVAYTSRTRRDAAPYRYFAGVRELAAESDVLVVACALTAATRHVVGRDVLEALGADGVLVNISRGATVDQAELVGALTEGRIAGAGLDVFENEPGAPAELFAMDNVVMTPHVAVFTAESMADLRDHTVANLEAFFSGQPVMAPVVLPHSPVK